MLDGTDPALVLNVGNSLSGFKDKMGYWFKFTRCFKIVEDLDSLEIKIRQQFPEL